MRRECSATNPSLQIKTQILWSKCLIQRSKINRASLKWGLKITIQISKMKYLANLQTIRMLLRLSKSLKRPSPSKSSKTITNLCKFIQVRVTLRPQSHTLASTQPNSTNNLRVRLRLHRTSQFLPNRHSSSSSYKKLKPNWKWSNSLRRMRSKNLTYLFQQAFAKYHKCMCLSCKFRHLLSSHHLLQRHQTLNSLALQYYQSRQVYLNLLY